MNEYKELIEVLKEEEIFLREEDYSADFVRADLMHDAADAIEQLVKERDDEREAADEWQHKYFELAIKCSQLEKERDAAIRDMSEYLGCGVCKYNTDEYLENGWCRECSVGKSTREHWEWRGVQDE